eukprot:6986563-Pyramimonas_sp.AAC.1
MLPIAAWSHCCGPNVGAVHADCSTSASRSSAELAPLFDCWFAIAAAGDGYRACPSGCPAVLRGPDARI